MKGTERAVYILSERVSEKVGDIETVRECMCTKSECESESVELGVIVGE